MKAAKSRSDLTATVISRLKAGAPKSGGEESYDVSRSSERIPSRVKFCLKTGIDPLDEATNNGLPFGRIIELYGLEGSGKSALAKQVAKAVQTGQIVERCDDNVSWKPVEHSQVVTVYIDNEQALDEDEKLVVDGVEIDAAIARCDTVDAMFKITDRTIDTVGKIAETSKVPCFVVIIVDTIAGTSSKEEMGAEWGKDDYSRQPKALRQGFRRLVRTINVHNVLMVCVNQVSDKIGGDKKKGGNSFVPQDSDFSTFGGRALKFFASIRIFMYKLNANYKLTDGAKFPSGFTIGFVVVKNRFRKPYRGGRMVLLYTCGLSNVYSLLETLVYLKLVAYEEREYSFRFGAARITPTTFPEAAGRGNPKTTLAEWPAFYQAHRADIDAMWETGKVILFSEPATDTTAGVSDEDPDPADQDLDD